MKEKRCKKEKVLKLKKMHICNRSLKRRKARVITINQGQITAIL